MYNPNEIEEKILNFWERNKIFDKLRKKNSGGKKFRFIDGPITANNPMGVHHAYARTLKDFYQRYMAMRGFDQRFQNGFDCHGLPVEVEVEKELNIHTKREIETYGVEKFIRKCKERVTKMSELQKQQSIRLGQWMDWNNSYFTSSDNNILHTWHFLKKCHENNWIYKGHRVLPWCIRCGTSLSQHEVGQGYKDLTHTSVFIKVPIKNRKNEFLLLWTTTVWTLSSNVAAAVGPNIKYIKAKKGDDIYYLSESTAHILGEYEKLDVLSGENLIGLEYVGPYDNLKAQKGIIHKVVSWDMVGEENGTGIVHIAPGCGVEDYELGKEKKLPSIAPLDENGNYIDGFDWLTGKNVNDVLELMLEDLDKRGLLYKKDKITHSYPTCWRCKEELVFRMTDAWFINMKKIRPQLIKATDKIYWYPDLGKKLMNDWLNNMGDWNISRARYWGLPLPFWQCVCGEITVIGSMEELKKLSVSGFENIHELHKPEIDNVIIKCPKCKKNVKRIPDVGDCWLDAGVVPYSTLNYLTDKKYWKEWFPAEFISEMREQIRLWFYSMLVFSIVLENRAPYEKVLLFEKVYDESGEEMHKSGKNVVWLEEAFEKMGADVMRWMYVKTNPTQNVLFGYSVAKNETKNLDYLLNIKTYIEKYLDAPKEFKKLENEDKWIFSRLETVKLHVYEYVEKLELHLAAKTIEDFYINDFSRTYIKMIRERLNDAPKLVNVLYKILLDTLKMMAPFTPFISESIYQDMFRKHEKIESIHLTEYPTCDKKMVDDKLEKQMKIVKNIVEAANFDRQEKEIKLKYVLPKLTVSGGKDVQEAVKSLEDLLKRMSNVKKVEVVEISSSYSVKLNYKNAGKKFGKDVSEVAVLVSKTDATKLKKTVETGKTKIGKFELNKDDLIFTEEKGEGKDFDGGKIILDTKITDALKKEWLLRELIRAVQSSRKEMGLNVKDIIKLYLPNDFKSSEKIIKEGTGSTITFGTIKGNKYSFEFEENKYEFGVEK